MTKIEQWKPTEEMVRLAIQVAPGAYDEPVIDILIAVQPYIAAQERERCAKVVENKFNNHGWDYHLPSVGREMAAAIRAMGEKEWKPTPVGSKSHDED